MYPPIDEFNEAVDAVDAGVERTADGPDERPLHLDPLQQQAIDHCRAHTYTNISGTAGVGKTLVAKQIMAEVPGTVLAATTGIASVNLGEGTTINSLLKYFDTADLQQKYTDGVLLRMINKLRVSGVSRILIDEKSMLSGQQLTLIARAVRESNEGGVYALEQVGGDDDDREREDGRGDAPSNAKKKYADLPHLGITLVGDFGQLPPVPDEDRVTGKKIPIQFAFESPEWPIFAGASTTLQTIYRQDAKDFVAALHAVRLAQVQQALQFFTPQRFSASQDDRFEGTTIFAKNDAVDRYNMLRLDQLHGAVLVAKSIRTGTQRGDWKLIPETLVLKEGALVMLLANRRTYDDVEDSKGSLVYANGDLATLVGKNTTGAWVARLQRNGRSEVVYPIVRQNTIPLEPGRRKAIKEEIKRDLEVLGHDVTAIDVERDESDETSYIGALAAADDREGMAQDEFKRRLAACITEDGKGKSEIIGTITYMPLRAAYGCTVHKTQGLTLDRVQVNIRDWMFKQPGMLFVALSRARSIDGLRIIGDQMGFVERCKLEPRVKNWL